MKLHTYLLLVLIAGATVAFTGCKEQYLTGYFDKETFVDSCAWKRPVDTRYSPDEAYMDSLQQLQGTYQAVLFVGTWCNSSEKWVARFLAIEPQLPINDLQIISVDTTKKDSLGLWQTYAVDSVPTFIFYEQERELGRIIVKPYRKNIFHKRNLEKHLYAILQRGEANATAAER